MCTLKTAPEPFGFPKEQKPEEIAGTTPQETRPLVLSSARPLVIAAVSFRDVERKCIRNEYRSLSSLHVPPVWKSPRRQNSTHVDRSGRARIAADPREQSVGVVPGPRRPVSKMSTIGPHFYGIGERRDALYQRVAVLRCTHKDAQCEMSSRTSDNMRELCTWRVQRSLWRKLPRLHEFAWVAATVLLVLRVVFYGSHFVHGMRCDCILICYIWKWKRKWLLSLLRWEYLND